MRLQSVAQDQGLESYEGTTCPDTQDGGLTPLEDDFSSCCSGNVKRIIHSSIFKGLGCLAVSNNELLQASEINSQVLLPNQPQKPQNGIQHPTVSSTKRVFLFFSVGKGRENMYSHLPVTRETDYESHTARHRCRKYHEGTKEERPVCWDESGESNKAPQEGRHQC